MKRLSTMMLLLTTLSAYVSSAQTEKGSFLLGGTAGASSLHTDSPSSYLGQYKATTVYLSPNIGYFVIDKLALGLSASISAGKTSYENIDAYSRNTTFGAGPFVRYYFPMDRWAIFPYVSYSLSTTNTKGRSFGYDPILTTNYHYNTTQKTFSAGVGATYFITRNIGLEGIVSYQAYNSTNRDLPDTEQSGLNFKVGFQIYLTKNSE